MIPLHPLKSSNLRAYGYQPDPGDAKTGLLAIQFHDGRTFMYAGVPETVFEAFLLSDSRGSFFHRSIKDVYRCIRPEEIQ